MHHCIDAIRKYYTLIIIILVSSSYLVLLKFYYFYSIHIFGTYFRFSLEPVLSFGKIPASKLFCGQAASVMYRKRDLVILKKCRRESLWWLRQPHRVKTWRQSITEKQTQGKTHNSLQDTKTQVSYKKGLLPLSCCGLKVKWFEHSTAQLTVWFYFCI